MSIKRHHTVTETVINLITTISTVSNYCLTIVVQVHQLLSKLLLSVEMNYYCVLYGDFLLTYIIYIYPTIRSTISKIHTK